MMDFVFKMMEFVSQSSRRRRLFPMIVSIFPHFYSNSTQFYSIVAHLYSILLHLCSILTPISFQFYSAFAPIYSIFSTQHQIIIFFIVNWWFPIDDLMVSIEK